MHSIRRALKRKYSSKGHVIYTFEDANPDPQQRGDMFDCVFDQLVDAATSEAEELGADAPSESPGTSFLAAAAGTRFPAAAARGSFPAADPSFLAAAAGGSFPAAAPCYLGIPNLNPEAPHSPSQDLSQLQQRINVVCGTTYGVMLLPQGEVLVDVGTPEQRVVSPTEFERLAGKGTFKNWRHSIKVVDRGMCQVGQWLLAYGFEEPRRQDGTRRMLKISANRARTFPAITAAARAASGRHNAAAAAAAAAAPSGSHSADTNGGRGDDAEGAEAGGQGERGGKAGDGRTLIEVACGSVAGVMRLPGKTVILNQGTPHEFTVSPTEFERMGGKGHHKRWRKNIRVAEGRWAGHPIGDWLKAKGFEEEKPPTPVPNLKPYRIYSVTRPSSSAPQTAAADVVYPAAGASSGSSSDEATAVPSGEGDVALCSDGKGTLAGGTVGGAVAVAGLDAVGGAVVAAAALAAILLSGVLNPADAQNIQAVLQQEHEQQQEQEQEEDQREEQQQEEEEEEEQQQQEEKQQQQEEEEQRRHNEEEEDEDEDERERQEEQLRQQREREEGTRRRMEMLEKKRALETLLLERKVRQQLEQQKQKQLELQQLQQQQQQQLKLEQLQQQQEEEEEGRAREELIAAEAKRAAEEASQIATLQQEIPLKLAKLRPQLLPGDGSTAVAAMADYLAGVTDTLPSRGLPLEAAVPLVCGRTLDLRALFRAVVERGGHLWVTLVGRWGEVLQQLGLGGGEEAAMQVQKVYAHVLLRFERMYDPEAWLKATGRPSPALNAPEPAAPVKRIRTS